MWKKILQIFCIYSYFAFKKANNDFILTSSYPIIYESIFHADRYKTKDDSKCGCAINLKGDTLEFSCTKKTLISDKCQVPEIRGSFKLDKEAKTMYDCLAELQTTEPENRKSHCDMSEEDYQRQIFKNCNNENVYAITIMTNKFKKSDYLNFLSSNLPNLTEIHVYQRYDDDDCQPLNQYLPYFKYVNKVIMYFESTMDVDRCTDLNFSNLTLIKELVIGISAEDIINKEYLTLYNDNLLREMDNLELLEFKCILDQLNLKIARQQFQGQSKLSSLRFINCNITNLTEDHFQDLVNLKSLKIVGGFTSDLDWLSSTIIRNKLEFLELDKQVDIRKDNLTAFICQGSNICQFKVDINKKPCPNICDCYLKHKERQFIIVCDRAQIGMKIPELPIPITGKTSLYFNNKKLTQLPNSNLYGFSSLRELQLANNVLTSITADQLPPNLTYLDLSGNSLQSLDQEVLEFLSRRAGRISMKLAGNPWNCNGDMFKFFENSSNIIEDRDKTNLECHGGFKPYYYICLGFAVMIFFYFYFKKSIFMWLYERNLCLSWILHPEPKADIVLKNDAFLAFSHVDLELIGEYVEKLERGSRKYKVCFYQRDWLIGESIPACILSSIADSKRVIILMTNSFINSSWGLFEFRTAIKATSMDKNKRLIVILYPGVDINKLDDELKLYMKYNTYLRRDDPLFWRKLMFSMPHKPVQSERPALTDSRAIEEDEL